MVIFLWEGIKLWFWSTFLLTVTDLSHLASEYVYCIILSQTLGIQGKSSFKWFVFLIFGLRFLSLCLSIILTCNLLLCCLLSYLEDQGETLLLWWVYNESFIENIFMLFNKTHVFFLKCLVEFRREPLWFYV